MIYDISPTLRPSTAVWPGDQSFIRNVALDIDNGDNLTLSSVTTTVHIGAHVDSPSHYIEGGDDIGSRPLSLYMGNCQVISVETPRGCRIESCPVEITETRVIFRTESAPDPDKFNTDFCALSPALIHKLAACGVRLVGIDTPSVDLYDDRELLSHKTIASYDMAILEGVVLTGVPDGVYNLIALPLRIEGADASPVRAVLVSI